MRVFGVSGRAVGVRKSVTVWVGVGVWLCMRAVHVRGVWLHILAMPPCLSQTEANSFWTSFPPPRTWGLSEQPT